jgi:hypothetical protein
MTATTFLIVVVIALGTELLAAWLTRKGQCCKEQTALLTEILQTDKAILAALSQPLKTATSLKFTFGQPINK